MSGRDSSARSITRNLRSSPIYPLFQKHSPARRCNPGPMIVENCVKRACPPAALTELDRVYLDKGFFPALAKGEKESTEAVMASATNAAAATKRVSMGAFSSGGGRVFTLWGRAWRSRRLT